MRILLLILVLTACGKDEGSNDGQTTIVEKDAEPEDVTMQSIGIKSRRNLPKCNDDNEAQLAYVIDEKVFVNCSNGDWLEVDIGSTDTTNRSNFYYDGNQRYLLFPDLTPISSVACPTGFTLLEGQDLINFAENILIKQNPAFLLPQKLVLNQANAKAYNTYTKSEISVAGNNAKFICKEN